MPYPKVKLSDNDGNAVGVTSNRLDVNVAGATMSTGDIEVNSEFPAAAAIADNFANPETTSVMSMGMAYEGSTWDRLTSTSGKLNVSTCTVTVIQDDSARTVNTISGFAIASKQLADGHNVIVALGITNGMELNAGTIDSGAAWGDRGGYSLTFDGLEADPFPMVANYTTTPFDTLDSGGAIPICDSNPC